jgi:GNAT acetyltransferase-like protein
VAADPCATPAHRAGVCTALAHALPAMEPRFVAVERDGHLIGGAPLVIARRAGFHWIHALPFLLPGAPLAVPGLRDEVDAAVAGAIGAIQRVLHAVGGEWSLYRPDAAPPAAPVVESVGGETRAMESAIVDLAGGIEAARARMERRTRQAIRGARARGLAFAEEPGALAEAYALYVRQSRGWRGHRPRPLELSRRLLAPQGEAAPLARLFTVRDARGLLSATLVLDHAREAMPWWSGTHPDARGREAATLLLGSVVEWAAGAGRARVNLGGSAGLPALAAFKRALGARTELHPVRWLDARHATPAGRALAAVQAALRRGRARGAAA